MDLQGRHPGTVSIASYFQFHEQRPEKKQEIQTLRDLCADLACEMVERLPDNPELTTGLRKLLEAKDCFVRAALDQPGQGPNFTLGEPAKTSVASGGMTTTTWTTPHTSGS